MASAHVTAVDRLMDAVAGCFTPAVARRIVDLRADPVMQARLDELADKANEGELSEEERVEYERVVAAMEFLALLQTKARAIAAASQTADE